ncbi:MAG TPA: AMP-binding protein, partial [Lacipirellulaceae bacterium]|nr:AMP-binding protein [Lacipirellulaceae bacterium]
MKAAPEPAAPEALVADVTRGQEPVSVNPLRAGSARREPVVEAAEPEQHDGDARAAFRDEADAPLPVAAAPLPVSAAPMADYRPAGDEPAEPTLAASAEPVRNPFGAAAPLPVTATPAYGGAPLQAAYGNAAAPSEEPVAAAPTVADAYAPASAGGYADAYAAGDAGLTPTPGITAVEGVGRPGERSLEGLQTPSLTVQKLAPPEGQVGKRATFAVRVQNNGSRTAHHVIVTDEVPQGAQLIGTAPKAAVSGAQVVWDLGTLGVGEERIVEMELLPTDEGELGSVATVSFAAQASAKARSTRPQLALRLSANPRVMIGDQQIVVIEVSNPGTGDATGVMLLETVPDGLSHEAGPALEFEIGTLRPGESRRLELVLQADAAGVIDNVMVARADANLQVQAGCQFEVIAPALGVTVEGPQKRFLERPATYMVNVDNPGTASARDVQLVTQLPPGMKFVSANNKGEDDAATHIVYRSLAELPTHQRGTVALTVAAVESGGQTLTYSQLDQWSNAIAWRISGRYGQHVGWAPLLMKRSPAYIASVLAVLKLNGAYVPIDPDWPGERVSMILHETAGAVLADSEVQVPGHDVLVIDPKPQFFPDCPVPTRTVDANSPAYLMYTSGTTGKPKGVVIPHRGILRLVVGSDFARMSRDDRWALMSSLAFDASTLEL